MFEVITILFLSDKDGYPELTGVHYLKDGAWISIPVLNEAFFRWLPYINVLWVLQLLLNVVLFRQGRWQPGTRWADMALDVVGIIIGYLLLSGPAFVGVSAEALRATGMFDAGTAATLGGLLQQAVRMVIVVVMIVQGVEVVKNLVRMVLRRG